MSILSVSSPITSTRKHKQVTTPTVSRFLLASAMASTNPFLKVARQHETTKTHLHKRVSNVPFQFKDIFPQDVVLFLRHKAVSVNSSIGYLTPALLTTAAFLTAKNGCTVETITHEQPVNIYMMFVGYPGTGKSSAIEDGCLQTIKDCSEINTHARILLDRTTSCGLVKHFATNQCGHLVSPEVFDVLNKLLRNDDENASGDAMYLCKLFRESLLPTAMPQNKPDKFCPTLPFHYLVAHRCQMLPN